MNTVGDVFVIAFVIIFIVLVGGWVFKKLYDIGGRNELEELADAQKEMEKLRKDLFD